MAQTLVNALLSVSVAAEQKDIDISVDCPQPCIIQHDPKWTEEAIFNLLDNAVKYTPSGGKIKVQVEMREAGTHLTISDTGMGIPEELQGAIFSSFSVRRMFTICLVQVSDFISLGKLWRAQGGYVTVTSNEHGSTFAIQFL